MLAWKLCYLTALRMELVQWGSHGMHKARKAHEPDFYHVSPSHTVLLELLKHLCWCSHGCHYLLLMLGLAACSCC